MNLAGETEETCPGATLSTTKSHMTTRSRTPDRSGWKSTYDWSCVYHTISIGSPVVSLNAAVQDVMEQAIPTLTFYFLSEKRIIFTNA
jgi:hypothetical protein